MYIISDGNMEVGISTYGAELEYIKIDGINILWKRSDLWNSQSPILFPIIGTLKDGFYFYEGKRYDLESHGYVRYKEFEVVYLDKNKIVLSSRYDEKTVIKYPFKYELRISYSVQNESLKCSLEVINLDDKQISFSIGIHPGFSYDGISRLLGENYKIKFSNNTVNEVLFNPSLVTGIVQSNVSYHNFDDLSRDLEIRRTICYEGINSLELYSNLGTLKILNEMTYTAFWQKNPNNNSKFMCIEGWEGIPDFEVSSHDIMKKVGNVILDVNDNYVRNFEIKFYKENM